MNPKAVPWKRWFLLLWGAEATGLAVLWFLMPFARWLGIGAVVFGLTELAGIHWSRIGLMPLTEAIRRYVPRWFAIPAISLFVGGAVARVASLHHKWFVAGLFFVWGWLLSHFDVTFDNPAR